MRNLGGRALRAWELFVSALATERPLCQVVVTFSADDHADDRRGGARLLPAAVPDVNTGVVDHESVREFIQRLTDAAGNLPGGLDSAVELAICDGKDLQFITRVDVSVWTTVPDNGPLQSYVLIRPHDHPGDSPGPRTRGAAAHADEELRWLTERDDD